MHSRFLSAGFGVLSPSDIQDLIYDVVNAPDERYVLGVDDQTTYIEYYRAYGDNIGLAVSGHLAENEEIQVTSCQPNIITDNKLAITNLRVDDNTKHVYVTCEDSDNGNDLVFLLQNSLELHRYRSQGKPISGSYTAYLAGFGLHGTVILPVMRTAEDYAYNKEQDAIYKELIARSRQGDAEADELLRIQADETGDIIRKRLKDEDFLSVIEEYLYPDEARLAAYDVLGDILAVSSCKNTKTNETVYRLRIVTLCTTIDIIINAGSLLGSPSVGMRFMGQIFLQSKIKFA